MVALVHVVAPEVDFGLEGFAVECAGDVAAVYGVPAEEVDVVPLQEWYLGEVL